MRKDSTPSVSIRRYGHGRTCTVETLPDGSVRFSLTKGKYAVIDAEDADRVLAFKWSSYLSRNTWYARRGQAKDGQSVNLHQFVLGVDLLPRIDHIDHDGLNNRKINLRPATNSQNLHNGRFAVGPSRFRGVRRSRSGRWYAAITINCKGIHIGTYDTPEEAARARDRYALDHVGEFAVLNFPEELEAA